MNRLFWVCVGGAAGTAARYGIALWAAGRFGPALPVGTAIVNLAGCFAIALVVSVAIGSDWPETLRLALTVGFLGGFTTYSSFNHEASRLLLEGTPSKAALYSAVTIGGGLVAGWLGLACGRALGGR